MGLAKLKLMNTDFARGCYGAYRWLRSIDGSFSETFEMQVFLSHRNQMAPCKPLPYCLHV